MLTSVIPTFFFVALMFAANVSGQNGLLAPPNLPGNLKNPGALNNYLKALNEYQDALSRPRFGRSNSKRFPSNEFAPNLPEQIDLPRIKILEGLQILLVVLFIFNLINKLDETKIEQKRNDNTDRHKL